MPRILRTLWSGSGIFPLFLLPFELLYRLAMGALRAFYALRPPSRRVNPPIIVVGGLTVGGAGKTPAVIGLAEVLVKRGLKTGIISRGYKGGATRKNGMLVNRNSKAVAVGDEPLLLARRTDCPVYVHPLRAVAAANLARECNPDLVISDDGLQHYAMHRSLEIAVLDAVGGVGNGHCLPAGPLREPLSRLKKVDYILLNCLNLGDNGINPRLLRLLASNKDKTYRMTLKKIYLRRAGTKEVKTIAQWKKLYAGKKVRAVCGIAQPWNFFDTLKKKNIVCETHSFPNHHRFRREDLNFATVGSKPAPIIITEKDAVKCEHFGISDLWVLCREVRIDARLIRAILRHLRHV